jgi:hypothetical protein
MRRTLRGLPGIRGSLAALASSVSGKTVRFDRLPSEPLPTDRSALPVAKKSKTKASTLTSPQEELVALAVLLLRRDSASQSELSREMYSVGFSTSRIAELLGTTANTINQAIQKGKKAKGAKRDA